MKQKIRRLIAIIIFAIIIVAVIVFAIVHSSHYNAPKKPTVSQTVISKQLATKAGNNVAPDASKSTTNQPVATPAPAANPAPTTPSPSQTSATPALTNTGPGDVLALFGISFVIATAAWYRKCLQLAKRAA